MLLLLAGLPLAVLWQVYIARQLTRLLNIHQIEEYQNERFWRWVRGAPERMANDHQAYAYLGLLIVWFVMGLAFPQLWAFLALSAVSAVLSVALALRMKAVEA